MFQADQLVVYPAQGVGKIESICHQEVGGVGCEFYIVRIVANNITLMVPVHNATNVGLRPLIDAARAEGILQVLCDSQEASVYTGQNWNRRYREYSDKLKSADPGEVALVVRELMIIGKGKELSFGERRLLEQAMMLVVGELAEVLKVEEDSLRQRIQAVYAPPVIPAATEA